MSVGLAILTFSNNVVDEAHAYSEVEEIPQMSRQLVEAGQQRQLLPVVTLGTE